MSVKLSILSGPFRRGPVLHAFTGGRKGFAPEAALFQDNSGNLYGTTYYGGPRGASYGTLFKLIP